MDMRMTVTGVDSIKQMLDRLRGEQKAQALSMALNKVAAKGRTEIKREISSEYAIKSADVQESISLGFARKSMSEIAATISIFGSGSRRGRSMNMIHFLSALAGVKTRGARATRKEIKEIGEQLGFNIKRAGGLKAINGAFVANKGRTRFRRVGKGRLPIDPVQVIGVSQMFRSRKIETRIMAALREQLPIEINRAVEHLLRTAR